MKLPARTTTWSRRSQHLVFLAHVWACAPFMVSWLYDPHVQQRLSDSAIAELRPFVFLIVGYLLGRTVLAWRNPEWLKWEYVFPILDTLLITAILYVSHRGPLSNLTLLYFLPIVEASASLNARWSIFVGLVVVTGTVLATLNPPPIIPGAPDATTLSTRDLFQQDPLNAIFRIYFLLVISSLMTFQASIAANYRAKAGVEADRNRIALEMHDGVQGSLIALASQLELLSLVAPTDGERAAQLAGEGRETARQAADELRFLVQRLRAGPLGHGFVPAMRQYAHNLCSRYGIAVEISVTGDEWELPADLENAMFRVFQEGLTNVIKHANAKSVRVTLEFEPQWIHLSVTDDGAGFEPAGARTGVGIYGMRERATGAGGNLELVSSPGSGTTIRLGLPRR